MNIAYRTPLTVPEYLAWAETQSQLPRTELIDGQIVEMTPALLIHARLKMRAFKALEAALFQSGLTGEVLPDGVLLPISHNSAFVPDAQLYLGEMAPDSQRLAPEPVLVLEVLSPTTAHIDRGIKLTGYFSLPSVQHYLIVDPDTASVTHYARGDGAEVQTATYTSGMLRLDPPGLTIDLDRVLKG
jgi:Uma2 family endonuclease